LFALSPDESEEKGDTIIESMAYHVERILDGLRQIALESGGLALELQVAEAPRLIP
jgi:hypothetical protein